MARYQEKIKEAYLLIIGERKRAPVILSKLFSANTEISARLLYFAIAIKQQNSLRSNSCCFNIALSAYNLPLQLTCGYLKKRATQFGYPLFNNILQHYNYSAESRIFLYAFFTILFMRSLLLHIFSEIS